MVLTRMVWTMNIEIAQQQSCKDSNYDIDKFYSNTISFISIMQDFVSHVHFCRLTEESVTDDTEVDWTKLAAELRRFVHRKLFS